jgi:predicted ribosomally synthesized peptide with nif11-like leader
MSKDSAKAFFEFVKSDEALAKRLHDAKSEDEVKEVITAAGEYDFSQEEWKKVVLAATGVEMSDTDLDKVAGGFNAPPPIFIGSDILTAVIA